MAFLNHFLQLRKVSFDKKYLWDVRFDGTPWPFLEFFPASDVEIEVANVASTFEFTRGNKDFRIPLGEGVKTLTLTFYDDETRALKSWLKDWMLSITQQSGNNTATLDTIVRRVEITQLTSSREIVDLETFWVFPEGTLTDSRSSASEVQTYSMTFVIVGEGEVSPLATGALLSIPRSPEEARQRLRSLNNSLQELRNFGNIKIGGFKIR